MSRLNYILSGHRRQSRTFAYIINSWYACLPLIWFGKTSEIFWIQTISKPLLQVRERERERETSACIRISFNLEKYHALVLKMILGDASRAHRLLHEVGYSKVLMLCMLSIACPIDETFFPECHSDLSWIQNLTKFFFFFFKGERIQISQKAGHHRPASETPLNGVLLACR